jgi:hypothetical protein
LRTARPDVPGIDILEVVFSGARGINLKLEVGATHPATAFGQLIAEAFDWVSPREWAAWTQPSEPAAEFAPAMLEIWRDDVLPRFYLWLAGESEVPVRRLHSPARSCVPVRP